MPQLGRRLRGTFIRLGEQVPVGEEGMHRSRCRAFERTWADRSTDDDGARGIRHEVKRAAEVRWRVLHVEDGGAPSVVSRQSHRGCPASEGPRETLAERRLDPSLELVGIVVSSAVSPHDESGAHAREIALDEEIDGLRPPSRVPLVRPPDRRKELAPHQLVAQVARGLSAHAAGLLGDLADSRAHEVGTREKREEHVVGRLAQGPVFLRGLPVATTTFDASDVATVDGDEAVSCAVHVVDAGGGELLGDGSSDGRGHQQQMGNPVAQGNHVGHQIRAQVTRSELDEKRVHRIRRRQLEERVEPSPASDALGIENANSSDEGQRFEVSQIGLQGSVRIAHVH